MASGKDSAEVIEFMSLYQKLRDRIGDDPEALLDVTERSGLVRKLCSELFQAARILKRSERSRRELFTKPVDPSFLGAWRDFEERYEYPLIQVCLGSFFNVGTSKRDYEESNVDLNAEIAADMVESAIQYAQIRASDDEHVFGDYSMTNREVMEQAVARWEGLKEEAGLELHGILRRRALIPFVLVPRHVAERHGSAEKVVFDEYLLQAHDAFVFGAPLAALALMRAIMETVLRDHYGAPGNNLKQRIDNAGDVLPPTASQAALHRLRKRANAVVHLDSGKTARIVDVESAQLEKEIISLLYVLRALIEGVPAWRAR